MNYKKISDELIAHSCGTFSKRPDQYVANHPSHIVTGNGCRVLGSDNKWYVDMVCGLGSNIINIQNNYCKESIFMPMLASEIKKRVPFIDKMKFVKTGSAACEGAVRYARAFTKKSCMLGLGYHGCHNVFIAAEKPGLGTVDEGYEKFDSLTDLIAFIKNTVKLNPKHDIAGCIVEPVRLDASESVKNQLIELRNVCTKASIVLIFDEIISGWRVPNYCFSQYWNIKPDLICIGKALGNGFPLAVIGGTKEIMDCQVFISNTHNGEESSLRESLHTIQFLNRFNLRKLWTRGGIFKNLMNKILPVDKLQIVGYNTRGEWQGEDSFKALFFEQMALRGVILGRAWFMTCSHDVKALHQVLDAAEFSMKVIKKGSVVLTGYIPQAVFKRN